MRIYDYVIVGGGISGLLIANRLSSSGADVAIVEAESHLGGFNRAAQLSKYKIENGLRFIAKSELNIKFLEDLENELGCKIFESEAPVKKFTYDSTGFKEFVGFGEKAPAFYDQLKYFFDQDEIVLTMPIYELVDKLIKNFKGEVLTRHIATRFHGENGQVQGLTVNGNKTVSARNYIYCGPVRDLQILLDDNLLNLRGKAKLKKSSYWMAVELDIVHNKIVSEDKNLFVLNGTTDDDIGPCIGRFFQLPKTEGEHGISSESNHQLSHQLSQWLSFIDLETSEEAENYGEVLKKIKRQIKRAFPESIDSIAAERISISPPLSAGELKLNANLTLPTASNLWIACSSLSQFTNLKGAFMQSQLTLSSLGFSSSVQFDIVNENSSMSQ